MPTTTSGSGLAPYKGQFSTEEAYHLLRRTTYGVSPEMALEAQSLGLYQTISRLLTDNDPLRKPINVANYDDYNVSIGQSWVDAPLINGREVNSYRVNSLLAWQVRSAFEAGFSMRPKLQMFWQNHFACSQNGDVRAYYDYLMLLRRNAAGNVRQLVKDVSTSVTMLVFLDGNLNKAESPNENYARELLELFTVGKGDLAGPGDYTTFTEEDVRALSRALTGWRVRYRGSTDKRKRPESFFVNYLHDNGDKQLSKRLGGGKIRGNGKYEIDQVIDMIFEQEDTSRFLCRKLYRWFVHHEIDGSIEYNIIRPLAEILVNSDFNLAPVLRVLLSSEHFFDQERRGVMIKNPLDHIIDTTKNLGYNAPKDDEDEEWFMRQMADMCRDQNMDLMQPPSVAGYVAYHQAPLYNRAWITSATLQDRSRNIEEFTASGFIHDFTIYRPELLDFISDFDNPNDPNELVREMAERLLPRRLESNQLKALKEVLIPGLPDFEWRVEYGSYRNDRGSEEKRDSIERKVRDLVLALFSTPEIHLS